MKDSPPTRLKGEGASEPGPIVKQHHIQATPSLPPKQFEVTSTNEEISQLAALTIAGETSTMTLKEGPGTPFLSGTAHPYDCRRAIRSRFDRGQHRIRQHHGCPASMEVTFEEISQVAVFTTAA